ncbi:MAG: caspase family protein [Bacteroidota bacterium]
MKIFLIIFSLLWIVVVKSQKPELILPVGHTDIIYSAIFSTDGKNIFSSSFDKTVKRWDVETGKPIDTYIDGENWIESIQLSSDGKYFLTVPYSGSKAIWNVSSGKKQTVDYKYPFNPVCLSNDGKFLLSEKNDSVAGIYETSTGNFIRYIQVPHTYIDHATFTFDNKYIYISSWENDNQKMLNSGKIWETESGNIVIELDKPDFSIHEIVFSNDSKSVLVAGYEGSDQDSRILSTVLLEIPSGKIITEFDKIKGIVTSLSFSNDEKYVAINTNENRIIAERLTGKIIRSDERFYGSEQGWIFSPDSKYYVQVENNFEFDPMRLLKLKDEELLKILEKRADPSNKHYSTASVRDINGGEVFIYIEGSSGKILSLSFSENGKYIVSSHDDNSIKIWDATNGMLIRDMVDHSIEYLTVSFLPDNKHFIAAMKDGSVKMWNLFTGRPDKTINDSRSDIAENYFSNNIEYLFSRTKDCLMEIKKSSTGKLTGTAEYNCFGNILINSPDSKYLILDQNDSISEIETETGKNIIKMAGYVTHAAFSYDSKFFIIGFTDGSIQLIESETGITIKTITGMKGNLSQAFFSKQGIYILLKEAEDQENYESAIYLYNIESGKILYQFENTNGYEFQAVFSEDEKLIFGGSEADSKKVWKTKTGKVLHEFQDSEYSQFPITLSSDGELIILSHYEFPAIYDAKSFDLIADLDYTEWLPFSISLSPDQKNILTSHTDNTARVWEFSTGKYLFSLEGHSDELISSEYSPDGKFILTYSKDHKIKLWDSSTGKELVTLISIDDNDWVVITPDMYYFASKGALKNMAWKTNNKVYNFEQFDLQYNRPDIVLERIGLADSSLIDAYRKAYYKRLKKMNIDEGMFSPEFHTPEIEILNKSNLPFIVNDPIFIVDIEASDNKFEINRINVWVNDVPLYGTDGINLCSLKSGSVIQTISVELSSGNNKIAVSCMNEKGVESLKETIETVYDPKEKTKPDLYIIAVSSDQYQQSQFNLSYSVNDGRSLVELFVSESSQYSNIYIDTVFNEQVNRENVLKLKEKLLKTNVDDHVVLYVSGHGLLDENLDFYFATNDVDFYNPSERGLSYDALEGLLDSIPARNKLFLMDACHSGEVDKAETEETDNSVIIADVNFKGLKSYSFKREAGKTLNNLSLQNSFELMQELFTNLSKGSGAVVISAASGSGFALEYKELEHGIFTYCILEAIQKNAADADNDQQISVNEIKDYVLKKVEFYTNGKQRPTSRRENLEFDFRVW